MPTFLTPVASLTLPSETSCEEVSLVRPETAVHEGCPVLVKTPPLIASKGVCSTFEWTFRNRAGQAVNLAECLQASSSLSLSSPQDPAELKVRITGCDENPNHVLEVAASAYDAEGGKVRFTLPEAVLDEAGIYRLDVAVVRDDRPLLVNSTLLSVERSLWGDTLTTHQGPPSLYEIRRALRDTNVENDLLDDVEFDDQEIIGAIVLAIQEWNETPPPVARFHCGNFPFRYHWLKAITGELLRTAVQSYLRNKMQASHGGLSINDRNKNREYLELAQLYRREWQDFVAHKKVEINVGLATGSLGSLYGARLGSSYGY